MKRKIVALLLVLSCVLLLAACQTAAAKKAREKAEARRREEERQRAIAEMGELNRQRVAQRISDIFPSRNGRFLPAYLCLCIAFIEILFLKSNLFSPLFGYASIQMRCIAVSPFDHMFCHR